MTQPIDPLNGYSFASMSQSNELLQEKYNIDAYFHTPLPYQIQAEYDWMNNPSPPSSVSTPGNSPTTHTTHLANSKIKTSLPSNRPTEQILTDSTHTIKEIQRITDAKSRRRQQNRESQRAFRERKNRHIEQLEQALADLQHRHEKLLQCFVGLTAKVSAQPIGNDGSVFGEQPRQYSSYLGKSGGAGLDFSGTDSLG